MAENGLKQYDLADGRYQTVLVVAN